MNRRQFNKLIKKHKVVVEGDWQAVLQTPPGASKTSKLRKHHIPEIWKKHVRRMKMVDTMLTNQKAFLNEMKPSEGTVFKLKMPKILASQLVSVQELR